MFTEPIEIQCPYCGEWFEIEVDPSVAAQEYVEDCAVCCQPVRVRVQWNDDRSDATVETAREND